MEIPKKFRRCCDCSRFCLYYEDDWSDVTPGNGLTLDCFENHFHISGPEAKEMSSDEYRKLMQTAAGCDDFQIEKE